MRKVTRLLAVGSMAVALSACSDDGGSTAAACSEAEGDADLISSYSIDVADGKGTARFTLSREADVGIVFTKLSDKPSPQRIRVPLGAFAGGVEHTRGLTEAELASIDDGEYSATLRGFDKGKLNVGEPVDTATRCVDVG